MTSPRAPFPWFGGKSRVAHLVWDAFGGDVANYVEPFAGSLAVLLGRPGEARVETVNDLDCYLANFWRAVQAAPDEVAAHADWPVSEADLHARHRWLVARAEFRERMRTDPDFYDAKIAGWWVWGICQWIGSGWCATGGREAERKSGSRPAAHPQGITADWTGRTNAGRQSRGIHAWHAAVPQKMPRSDRGTESRLQPARTRDITNAGNWRKRPALGRSGRGVHLSQQLPVLSGDGGSAGRGVHALGKPVNGVYAWFAALMARLRRVRVCCGDWKRVVGPAVTTCIGVTAVFLDPPYADTAGRDPSLYSEDSLDVAHAVREWAIANGEDPALRIALCGYEGEHRMPSNWRAAAWRASGGYASRNKANKNHLRERIWFSPHCLGVRQQDLFAAGGRP